MKIYVTIKCNSFALGDTLACVAVVEHYRQTFNLPKIYFDCIDWMWEYFAPAYTNIEFTKIENPEIILNYHFDLPVQKGFAFDLYQIPISFKKEFVWDFVKPKIVYKPKAKRQILNPYFVFSMHSTAQVKYWNSGKRTDQTQSPRWRDLCVLLENIGIEGVLVDKHYGFGTAPYWNEPPENCKKVIGRPFNEVLEMLIYAEFFVGLSSGMSWVALALGKKTCMIAPWAYDENEFGSSHEEHIRIQSKSHCTDCWSALSQTFNKNDWYWCPLKQNTSEEFSCSSSIQAKDVINELKKYNWI